ncbi:NAD(P)H-quinone oxidoreductase chain 4 chloroplastic [Bienertia sinuspersici]
MGAYGLIRINMELLPHAHSLFSPWLMTIGTIQIVYASLTSPRQPGTSYDRIRLVYLDKMGRIGIPMPKIFTLFNSFSMASLALPVIGISVYQDFVLSLSVEKVKAILFKFFDR